MRARQLLALLCSACGAPAPEVVVATRTDVPVVEPAIEPVAAIVPDVVPPLPEAPDDGWRRGEVASGQSLSGIVTASGLAAKDVAELVAALEPVMDPASLRVGQGWALRRGDDGRLAELELQRSATTKVRVVRGDDGKLVASAVEAETTVERFELAVTIDSSLSGAVTDAGGDAALVAAIVDVFASRIDFYTDPRRGDRVAVVVERHRLDGAHVRFGDLLAAEYRGAEVGTITGVRWAPDDGEASWYTPDGKSLDRTLLKSPLKYARMSSGFDPKRMHPVLHRVKGHFGVDYAAPVGTPVWAAAGGEIVFRGPRGGAGNMVVLAHDGGFQTVYMHLSRFADGQRTGQRVAQKTVIGYVGNTGLSTGPHLHFGVKRGGRWVDPSSVRAIERPGVGGRRLARFGRDTAEVRARLDELLASPATTE